MRENAYHEDKGRDDGATDRHRKDRDEDLPRNINVGKWVIDGLSARKPIAFAFIVASWEGDSSMALGSTPGLEDGGRNCTILAGKEVVSMSGTRKNQGINIHPGAPEGDEVPPEVPEIPNDSAEDGDRLKLFERMRYFQTYLVR